jgi:hypothetical protein
MTDTDVVRASTSPTGLQGGGLHHPTAGRASFLLTSDRLERALTATHKRNAQRPAVDYGVYRAGEFKSPAVRDAVRFFVENLYFLEAAGAANLAQLASVTPIATVRAAYGAQMSDELVHGELLRRYAVECLGETDLRENPAALLSRRLGKLLQRNPILGVECVTMPIEYYATNLITAVLDVVQEPALQAGLGHIRQDEGRHMVITTEAVLLLEQAGIGTSAVMRVRRDVAKRATHAFSKRVLNGLLRQHCGVLGIPWDAIYDRSMDEIAAALARLSDKATDALIAGEA